MFLEKKLRETTVYLSDTWIHFLLNLLAPTELEILDSFNYELLLTF